MINITNFDTICGAYKGTDVIYGSLDKPVILHLKDWYEKNVDFVEYDGTSVQVAFLNFIKYYLNPNMDWKRESNTYKVTDNTDHNIYHRRTRHGGNRPTSRYYNK